MKNNKFKSLLILFTILLSNFSIGYSLDDTNKYLPNINITIQYCNQHLYTIGRPVIVEFKIINNDSDPFLFLTSFNKTFTFDFEVSTLNNMKIDHSNDYSIKRKVLGSILSDEITLKQNEVYGAKIDISKWFNLTEPGEYIIKGIFYPGLITNEKYQIPSENELILYLNPPYPEEVKRKEEIEKIKRLKALSMPPYKVVSFMLDALMKRDFEKYFLYIKFDKFIFKFQNATKKYINAKDIDKPLIKEEFKEYLKGNNKLEALPFSETIPCEYDIVKTIIEKKKADVTVIETFKVKSLVEKKEYTYHLHLYEDKWFLEYYEVRNK